MVACPHSVERLLRHFAAGEQNFVGFDLTAANLTGAQLPFINLSDANLHRANLKHAFLPGADWVRAQLRQACLAGINLIGADLLRAHLHQADLYRALWAKFLYYLRLFPPHLCPSQQQQDSELSYERRATYCPWMLTP